MEIKSLGNTAFGTIYEAWNQAFAEYEIQLSKEQLQGMLKRRGFNAELSFRLLKEIGSLLLPVTGSGVSKARSQLTIQEPVRWKHTGERVWLRGFSNIPFRI